jgi:hypothetical protein
VSPPSPRRRFVDSSIPNGVNRPPTRRTTTAFLDNGPCYFIDCLSQPSISTSTALLYGNNHKQDIEDDDDDDDDEVDDVDDGDNDEEDIRIESSLGLDFLNGMTHCLFSEEQ